MPALATRLSNPMEDCAEPDLTASVVFSAVFYSSAHTTSVNRHIQSTENSFEIKTKNDNDREDKLTTNAAFFIDTM